MAGYFPTFCYILQQECLTAGKLVDIEYYHRPISIEPDCKPLQRLIIVLSTYTTSERAYLGSLATALGGEVNQRYMRKQFPILICPTPIGQKYSAAIKWGKSGNDSSVSMGPIYPDTKICSSTDLPVVSCKWLRECHELQVKVPMRSFAVGESKCEDDEENSYVDNSIICDNVAMDDAEGLDIGINEKPFSCTQNLLENYHQGILGEILPKKEVIDLCDQSVVVVEPLKKFSLFVEDSAEVIKKIVCD